MFGSLGMPELLFILVLALLVFGPKRLPDIGRTLGRGLAEFRRASNDLKRSLDDEVRLAEEKERRLAVAPPPTTGGAVDVTAEPPDGGEGGA